ncbi:hypothetical protein JDV02_006237 [Purpureocillium takamizusanense]|uniref:Uncharacterized protein n=1 Tax=Purpureocillium takamizusanense TaxID=2060973 RepID=A0A9Q8QI80_9HYPO|nr:uncharacterized protein JDV02_006237 [Purpureocillium takamizusanense]UNI20115.1 hypothetical protein JDV02_006237 [Purpureocillium takamizusanense]
MSSLGDGDEHRNPDQSLIEQGVHYNQGGGYSMGFAAGQVSEDDLIDHAMEADDGDPRARATLEGLSLSDDAAPAGELDYGAEDLVASYTEGEYAMFNDTAALSTPKTVRFADELETVIPPSPDYYSTSTSSSSSPLSASDSDEPCHRVEGCTENTIDGGEWRMSSSMMMAYSAMRGGESITDSGSADQAATHPGVSTGEANIFAHHASSLTADARKSDNDNPGTQDIFAITRPDYEHLTLPAGAANNNIKNDDNNAGLPEHIVQGLKRQAQLEGKHSIDELYDVSDGEDDVADGRISPCTFRLWADGAAEESERAGPHEGVTEQVDDEIDDYELDSAVAEAGSDRDSPQQHDDAEEEANTVWPPARYAGNLDFEFWLESIAPAGVVRHYPRPVTIPAQQEYLSVPITDEEIQAALAAPDLPEAFDGIAPEDVYEELQDRHQRLAAANLAVTDAIAAQWTYAQRINRRALLVQQAARAAAAVEQRAEQQQQLQQQQDPAGRRRREVYRYVEARLRGVAAHADEVEAQAVRLWTEVTDMMRVDRALGQTALDLARAVGLTGRDLEEGDLDALCERVIQMGRE